MFSFRCFHAMLFALVLIPILPLPATAQMPGTPENASSVPFAGKEIWQEGRDRMPPPQWGMPGAHAEGPGAVPFLPCLRRLNLTEAQEDKIFQIRYVQAPALRDAMKKAYHAEEDLRALALAPVFNASRAKVLAEAAGKARGEMVLLQTTEHSQILAVLTSEQRAKFDESAHRPAPDQAAHFSPR